MIYSESRATMQALLFYQASRTINNYELVITTQLVSRLKERKLPHKNKRQPVYQLLKIESSLNIIFLLGLTLMILKDSLLINIPAEPREFDLSNSMLKLCGFSFFSALLISLFTINQTSMLHNNQWRLV